MKYATLSLIILLSLAVPASAADRFIDLSGFATWVDPNSEGTFDRAPDVFDVDLGDEVGFGASVNVFWGDRFSTEFAISQVESPFQLSARERVVNVSDVDVNMIPITGILQWHLAPNGTIDPYVGAGVAYIVFGGDLDDDNTGNLALDDIEGNDLGFVVNGGLSLALGSNFAIFGDVKYIPTATAAQAVLNDDEGTEAEIEISPIIVSAGLSFRF